MEEEPNHNTARKPGPLLDHSILSGFSPVFIRQHGMRGWSWRVIGEEGRGRKENCCCYEEVEGGKGVSKPYQSIARTT